MNKYQSIKYQVKVSKFNLVFLQFCDWHVVDDVVVQDVVELPILFVVGPHEEQVLVESERFDVVTFALQIAFHQLVSAGQGRSLENKSFRKLLEKSNYLDLSSNTQCRFDLKLKLLIDWLLRSWVWILTEETT